MLINEDRKRNANFLFSKEVVSLRTKEFFFFLLCRVDPINYRTISIPGLQNPYVVPISLKEPTLLSAMKHKACPLSMHEMVAILEN